jgi:hypothetical protein
VLCLALMLMRVRLERQRAMIEQAYLAVED